MTLVFTKQYRKSDDGGLDIHDIYLKEPSLRIGYIASFTDSKFYFQFLRTPCSLILGECVTGLHPLTISDELEDVYQKGCDKFTAAYEKATKVDGELLLKKITSSLSRVAPDIDSKLDFDFVGEPMAFENIEGAKEFFGSKNSSAEQAKEA